MSFRIFTFSFLTNCNVRNRTRNVIWFDVDRVDATSIWWHNSISHEKLDRLSDARARFRLSPPIFSALSPNWVHHHPDWRHVTYSLLPNNGWLFLPSSLSLSSCSRLYSWVRARWDYNRAENGYICPLFLASHLGDPLYDHTKVKFLTRI